MTYLINGKLAYKVAEENGINAVMFYQRIKNGYSVEDAATKKNMRRRRRYIIKRNGEKKCTCLSTQQVADYIGTSKGTVCGLFFRHGNKIQLFGYTIKRT